MTYEQSVFFCTICAFFCFFLSFILTVVPKMYYNDARQIGVEFSVLGGKMKNKSFNIDEMHQMVRAFRGRSDPSLYIKNVGYDNFDYVSPIKFIHRKDVYVLQYVLSGKGTLHLGEKIFKIREKQFFLVPPKTDCMYYPDDSDKWKYIWISFGGNLASMIASTMGFSPEKPVVHMSNFKDIEEMLIQMLERMGNCTINEFFAKAVFYAIAGELSTPEKNEELVKKSVVDAGALLWENLDKSDFTVESLCQMLFVSHSALCKAFKEKTGMTPVKYLIKIRMEHAATLLRESTVSVHDIVSLVGYRNERHFLKTFKAYYGLTPTEYRQHINDDKSEKIITKKEKET